MFKNYFTLFHVSSPVETTLNTLAGSDRDLNTEYSGIMHTVIESFTLQLAEF